MTRIVKIDDLLGSSSVACLKKLFKKKKIQGPQSLGFDIAIVSIVGYIYNTRLFNVTYLLPKVIVDIMFDWYYFLLILIL